MQIDEVRDLHASLCQARVATAPSTANELQHELKQNTKQFLDLLDDAPKNEQDRKTLQEGRVLLNGSLHKVNQEFIQLAGFLSNQLGVNEIVAANLLWEGMESAESSNSTNVDAAITIYHQKRSFLLESLEVILLSAKDTSTREDVRNVFQKFVAELLRERVDNGTFPAKIIKTIKHVCKTHSTLSTTGLIPQQPPPPPPQQQQQQPVSLLQPQQPQQPQPQQPQSQPQPSKETDVASGRLGEDITNFRLEKLMEERVALAQILYHLASLFWLDYQDVLSLADTLQYSELSDISTSYMLLALMGAISVPDHHFDLTPLPPLYRDVNFLRQFHDRMLKVHWKVPAVKAVVMVQWALFMRNAVKIDHTIEPSLPTRLDDLDKLIFDAIDHKAFDFMNEYLLYFQQENSSIDTDRGLFKLSVYDDKDVLTVDPSDFTKFNADIRPEFYIFVIHELETLTTGFIDNLMHIIRQLKYKEEDTNAPGQSPLSTRANASEDDSSKCRDLEKFMELMASIYRERINAGWKFWLQNDSELPSFVKWLVEIRQTGTVRACYNFLASISTGDVCAPRAFQELVPGTNRTDLKISSLFSWGKLFAAFHFYAPQIRSTSENTGPSLPNDEVELLIKFLLLLQQVVQYSSEARRTLWVDPVLLAPQSIVEMLSGNTSYELRAALYKVLGAFCSPWGGGVDSVGRTIAEQVWQVLETSDFFLPKRESDNQQQQLQQSQDLLQNRTVTTDQRRHLSPLKQPGLLRDLEMERSTRDYKVTRAVVKLLASAIHTRSRREELIGGFSFVISTVPAWLGKATRPPGAEPYISLVIDNIFNTLDSQQYLYPGAKWELAEACLKVFENSVLSLDLQHFRQMLSMANRKAQNQVDSYSLALQGKQSAGQSAVEMLQPLLLTYLAHPGFTVMVRLLSGSHFANAIFKIVEASYNGIVAKQERSPYFVQCVVRCLRLIHRVLELQDTFCNQLIPSITGLSSRMASSQFKLGEYTYPALPSLTNFGYLMLVNSNAIVQLSLLVNCEDQEEICYLSTKILQALSMEPHDSNIPPANTGIQTAMGGIGAKLPSVLHSCKDASSILYAFSQRVAIDDAERTTAEDYEYDINNIPFWLAEKTIQNTFSFESDFRPSMSSSVRLAIIDLLLKNSAVDKPSPTLANFLLGYTCSLGRSGINLQGLYTDDSVRVCFRTILNMMNRDVLDGNGAPLIATHPVLAEKCYQLIYLLCAKDSTSSVTMRYLRSKENFFYNHLCAMPARLQSYSNVYDPSFRGIVRCSDGTTLTADFFVILSQLHQRAWLLKSVALELHILASSNLKSETRDLLELLYEAPGNSDDDTMDMDRDPINMFGTRRFQQPLQKIFEVMSSLDFTWHDALEPEGGLGPLNYFAGFNPEVFVIDNERGCSVYDIRSVYQLLRQSETNKRDSHLLDSEQSRLDLENEMGRILQYLMAQNHQREIANGRQHCLRAWKQVVNVTLFECFDLFPFEAREKLIDHLLSTLLPKMKKEAGNDSDILKGFSEVILVLVKRLCEHKKRQEVLAGSRSIGAEYTRLPDEKLTLIFNGILDAIQEDGNTIAVRGDMYVALVNFLDYAKDGSSSQATSGIQDKFIEIMSTNEKFLDTLCTDASDGLDIWKTTAYVALDALYVLNNRAILAFMVKKNFLQCSIDMLRREDEELVRFREQPDALPVAVYIYESKMSFFLRLALSKEGSKLLLNNRLIDVLSHCHFINPGMEQSIIEQPNTTADFDNRYERILTPVLELVSALLCSLGHVNVIDKIEGWARKQQDALLYILKGERQQVTIGSLTQINLVTSILYHLAGQQGFFDDLVTRGLNQLHTAMMHLIAKYLVPRKIASQVVPCTDEEKELAQKQVFENGGASALAVKAEQLVFSIEKNLVGYAQSAAFVTGAQGKNAFKPVFSNTLTSDDNGVLSMRNVSIKVPSLSTLAVCIRETVKTLLSSTAEYKLLLSQENNVASLKYEEVREIAETAFPPELGIQFDLLSPSQQQQVLATQVDKRAQRKAEQMDQLIFILENALLLLWRHLVFYILSSPEPLDVYATDSFTGSSQTTMFQPSVAVASSLKTASSTVLEPILKKTEDLDMGIPPLQSSTIHDLCNRIKNITTLHFYP